MTNNLLKIGVFYDGNYFSHVSNYYNYEHPRKSRLSINGLHKYIRQYLASAESVDKEFVKITSSHYFRGRMTSHDALASNKLLSDRIFDDILMMEGVVTHYLPLKFIEGKKFEKGIDVYMALEAYELSLYKKFDIVVLIACDGDYIPLVKKLNSLGVKVMLLAWEFKYTDSRTGRIRETVTSIDLINECVYPVLMHEEIDSKVKKNKLVVDNLFVKSDERLNNLRNNNFNESIESSEILDSELGVQIGNILSLKNGYGFISKPPNNVYFHWTNVVGTDFNSLSVGDRIEFTSTLNDKGQEIATEIKRV